MSELFPLPEELERVEYAQLYFHLQISDYFDLPALGLLQLRRELLQALAALLETDQLIDVRQARALLQPPLPDDHRLKRLVQKPAPAFVLKPDISRQGLIEPKEQLVLPALFVGAGLNGCELFARLLEQLGNHGLYRGTGQFSLAGVEAADASGSRAMLWSKEEPQRNLIPPISDLLWWLQRQKVGGEMLSLQFTSPLRLLRQKKPLFKPDFADIFPHILRRVTAMLASHAAVEVISDPVGLIQQATQVEVVANHLQWQDWRRLRRDSGSQELGGLRGELRLKGPGLAEILWVLQLGSLFNLGKGAGYGAGQYGLRSS